MVSIRNKALQYLGRRDHSRQELAQKLALAYSDVSAEEINAVLDDFIERGWQSDARFAEQWVYFRSQRYGQQRLRHELQEKGVNAELIASALLQAIDHEIDTARQVWQKKFNTAPIDHQARGKQLRYLASRGFSLNVIYQVVGEADEFDGYSDGIDSI